MRTVEQILRESKTVAVVGLSPHPDRDSHEVARYLQRRGYRIIPVNPGVDEILGESCYPDLLSIPGSVDVVDIFRQPGHVPSVVEQAVQKGVSAVWMQLGILNEEAAQKALEHGIDVVMDKCMFIEHKALTRKAVDETLA